MGELDFVIRLLLVSVFVAALGVVAIYEAFKAVMEAKEKKYKALRVRFEKTVMPYEALDLSIRPFIIHRDEWEHGLIYNEGGRYVRNKVARAFADRISELVPIYVKRTPRGDAWEFHASLRIRNDREYYTRVMNGQSRFSDPFVLDVKMTELINKDLLREGGNND